jgi:hypothetical protein
MNSFYKIRGNNTKQEKSENQERIKNFSFFLNIK